MRSRSSPPMDVDMSKHALVTQNTLKGSKQTIKEGKDSHSSNNNESEKWRIWRFKWITIWSK